jgi:hypothetical protein
MGPCLSANNVDESATKSKGGNEGKNVYIQTNYLFQIILFIGSPAISAS